jgi:hypothetical protein
MASILIIYVITHLHDGLHGGRGLGVAELQAGHGEEHLADGDHHKLGQLPPDVHRIGWDQLQQWGVGLFGAGIFFLIF